MTLQPGIIRCILPTILRCSIVGSVNKKVNYRCNYFLETQRVWPRYINVTDGRTDGQLTMTIPRFVVCLKTCRSAGGWQPRVPGRVLRDARCRDSDGSDVRWLHESVSAAGTHTSRLQRYSRQFRRSEEIRRSRRHWPHLDAHDAQGLVSNSRKFLHTEWDVHIHSSNTCTLHFRSVLKCVIIEQVRGNWSYRPLWK